MAKLKASEVADIPQRTPGEPEYYPNSLWSQKTAEYSLYWQYYEGDILDENCESGTTESGDPLKKFPLQINLAKLAIQKHAFALLGEYGESSVVDFHAKPQRKSDRVAEAIDDWLTDVWAENSAMGLLPEQARIAYVCGGCVFKLAYDPEKRNKVRMEVILPDYFFPVWDSTDYHHLLEVEVGYTISTREAQLKYGYRPSASAGESVLYKERWTETTFEITIGDQPARAPDGTPYGGPNPFIDPRTGKGIIPFEYFPVDRTGQFYGTSIIKQLMGLQDEYNARDADVGDAINDGVHPQRYAKNLPPNVKEVKLSRFSIKNLGRNAPNQPEPTVDFVPHPGLPIGTSEFLSGLKEDFRQVSHTPPVAYGVDEGSQRSALTLAFRMWSLTSFVRDTRGMWSASFASMNRKAMIIGLVKGGGVEEKWLDYELTTKWAPIIPRDREQLVSECVLLVQAKLRAPETAIQNLGDIDDIQAEIEKIKEWQEYLASLGAIAAEETGLEEGARTDVETPEAEGLVE